MGCGGGQSSTLFAPRKDGKRQSSEASTPAVVTGTYLTCEVSAKDATEGDQIPIGCNLRSPDDQIINVTTENNLRFYQQTAQRDYVSPSKSSTPSGYQALFYTQKSEVAGTRFIANFNHSYGAGQISCDGGKLPCREVLNQLQIYPDYDACEKKSSNCFIPSSGGQVCPNNSAVIIVNDGSVKQLSCVPLGNGKIFSSLVQDRNIKRSKKCSEGEVQTGMTTSPAVDVICSKINTSQFMLSAPGRSQYVKTRSGGPLQKLLLPYNLGDTCVCPEGTVSIGNHSDTNDRCAEECVSIYSK